MYKTRSRFMRRLDGGAVDKVPRMKNEGPEFRITLCLRCESVINTPSAKGSCPCGGKLAKVDGMEFLGRVKLQLMNEIRKGLGILKKNKREKAIMEESKIKSREVSILILPKGHWSPKVFPRGVPPKIKVSLTHIPTSLTLEKIVDGKDYHGNGPARNINIKNNLIAEELCLGLEVGLGIREGGSNYLLERRCIPGDINIIEGRQRCHSGGNVTPRKLRP